MGYAPIAINELKAGMKKELSIPGFGGKKKVKLKDLAVFSRQFATMINAGLSLCAPDILPSRPRTRARPSWRGRNDVETGNARFGRWQAPRSSRRDGQHGQGRRGPAAFLDAVLLQDRRELRGRGQLRAR
jgi:type IV pilus assembly protein PilC